jgi:hypothetical protein
MQVSFLPSTPLLSQAVISGIQDSPSGKPGSWKDLSESLTSDIYGKILLKPITIEQNMKMMNACFSLLNGRVAIP